MCQATAGSRDIAIKRTVSKAPMEVRAPMPSLRHVERTVPLVV